MVRRISKSSKNASSVLGKKTFAAITAVEGLKLNAVGRKRVTQLSQSTLSPDQRRAEVIRAYVDTKSKK